MEYATDSFEVILVDDGGSCDLESVLKIHSRRLAARLIRQVNGGPASARNLGASFAAGEFLAFTDDDCEPDPAWLQTLQTQLAAAPEHMIGGRIVNGAPDNFYATASQLLHDALYSHYNRNHNTARFFTSNNFAISARLFYEVGGFEAGFPMAAGEDREFCDRWRRSGFGLTYAPEAVVRHNHRMSLATYWSQNFRYGRGACQYRRIARKARHRVAFEGLTFYWDILRQPLQELSGWAAARQSGAMALAQFAVSGGYFWEALLGGGASKTKNP